MSSANSESFASFLIWIPFISLIPFISVIAVARTSRTMLNNSGEIGHSCLVQFFTIENNVCYGFIIRFMGFSTQEY